MTCIFFQVGLVILIGLGVAVGGYVAADQATNSRKVLRSRIKPVMTVLDALPARVAAAAGNDDKFCKFGAALGKVGVTTKVVKDDGSTNKAALEEIVTKLNAMRDAAIADKC